MCKVRQTLEGSSVRRIWLQVFFRRPLRGDPSRRSGGRILTDQLAIGQATTRDRGKGDGEAVSIVDLPSIEPEGLLIEVAKQMEWFDTDIGTLEPALQQTPEVLDGVGMHVSFDIRDGVVDDLMGIFTVKSTVRLQRHR